VIGDGRLEGEDLCFFTHSSFRASPRGEPPTPADDAPRNAANGKHAVDDAHAPIVHHLEFTCLSVEVDDDSYEINSTVSFF
jgi:hypothetical protein